MKFSLKTVTKEKKKMKLKKRDVSMGMATILFLFIMFFLIPHITFFSLSISSSSSPKSIKTTQEEEETSKVKTTHLKIKQVVEQPFKPSVPRNSTLILCDRSHSRYDICSLNGPTTIDPTKSTLYLLDSAISSSSTTPSSQKIRPYPRKWETNIMNSHVKEFTLLTSSSSEIVPCKIHHQVPAIVFSSGGYTGNLFHDFADGFVPLYVTLRTVFPDSKNHHQKPILVISECHKWWVSKYRELLKLFTPYPIISVESQLVTHCFPSATIGLISHGFMTINPTLLPNNETFKHFRGFLEAAYDRKGRKLSSGVPSLSPVIPMSQRPRLVLASRTGKHVGRVIVNQAEVVLLAKEVGFEVTIFKPTRLISLREAYGLLSRSHVMVGVHGAALTHFLFLRPKSVFMQVVPIGTEWLAETCFGKPAKEMGLEYMEYTIKVNESSLVEKYGKDHLVMRKPWEVYKEKWSNTKEIYLKGQNVIVDLFRFGKYLKKAYKKAKCFMDRVG